MKWPAGFEPDNSSVYARNEIAIAAPPERIWRWLIRAAKWPEWYSNSANVNFIRGNPPDLARDTEFKWKTFGATVTSRVIIFEPAHELGWDARGVLTRLSRLADRTGWPRRMPRHHRGMPERPRAETRVVVSAPDARARASELGREPQARSRRRRSVVASERAIRPPGSLRSAAVLSRTIPIDIRNCPSPSIGARYQYLRRA